MTTTLAWGSTSGAWAYAGAATLLAALWLVSHQLPARITPRTRQRIRLSVSTA